MAGLLAPIKREVAMGKLQVRETFSIPKIGTVAGCMVTEGKINRKAHLRIIRDAIQVYEGKIGSLRRFKDDVSEVQHGFECGVMVAGYNEIKTGDVIEAYEVIEEAAAALSPSGQWLGRSCTSAWPSSAWSSTRAIRSRKSGWCCGGSRTACASGCTSGQRGRRAGLWQRAELGCAVASGDRAKALELIDDVVRVAIGAGGARDRRRREGRDHVRRRAVPFTPIDDRTGAATRRGRRRLGPRGVARRGRSMSVSASGRAHARRARRCARR